MFVNIHSSHHRPTILYLILLVALPFALFWRWLLLGEVLFWGVIMLQFWPWHYLARLSLLSGQWPLWNPLLGNGAPLLANLQTAVFYPPNLLYLLLPVEHGLTLSIILHLGLAGVTMFFYTRQLGLSPFASALSGLTFMFSGYLVGRTQFVTMINAAAWYPLLLLLSERLVTRRNHLDVVWLGLALAGQLLAGHAQLWFYSLWLILVYVLVRSWQTANNEWRIANSKKLGPNIWLFLYPLVKLILAIVLAGLLSAAQILPTAEYVTQSPRHSGAERVFALTYSFWPWRLLTLLVPDLYGHPASDNYWGYANYWEDHAYLGILPFLLALIGVWNYLVGRVWGRGAATGETNPASSPTLVWPAVPFFAILVPISLVLALGWNTPLYLWLFDYVPGFSFFQAPARLLIWYTVGMAVLAGFGAHTFTLTPAGRRNWPRLLVVALGLIIAGGAGSFILTGRSLTFVEATLTLGIGLAISAALLLAYPRRTNAGQAHRRKIIWQAAILAWVAFDLWWAARLLIPTVPAALFSSPIASAEFLKTQPGSYRLIVDEQFAYDAKFKNYFQFQSFGPANWLDWLKFKETLTPNLGVYANLAASNNDDPLVVGRWQILLDLIESANPAQRARLLAVMNAGYYLDAVDRAVWPVLYTDGSLAIQQTPTALPRAYFAPQAYPAADAAAVIARLGAPDFDYRQEVIIMEAKVKVGPSDLVESGQAADTPVKIVKEEADHVVLSLNAPVAGYVVLTDTFYPGWQATLDGRPVEILPANLAFKAVAVEAGHHELVFSYQPASFSLGLGISIAALLMAGIAVIWLTQTIHQRSTK